MCKLLLQNTCFNDGDVNLVQFLQEIASEQQFEVTYVDIEEKSISGKFLRHGKRFYFKNRKEVANFFRVYHPLSTISTSTSSSLVGMSSFICSLNANATRYGFVFCL
jgi:hypothetical protein